MSYTVYMHTSPSGKRYVGITGQDPLVRWGNGKHYGGCRIFNFAIRKYGWENIQHEILLSGITRERAEEAECFYIALFRTTDSRYGYNVELGGNLGKEMSKETRKRISETLKGRTLSDDHRRKLSESRKGEKHPLYGKHLTEETRRKISEAGKGRVTTEETRRKISEAQKGEKSCHYGKPLSEEHRRKLSEAGKGKQAGEKHHLYGKHHSEETRRKISDGGKGLRRSEETCRKISEAKKKPVVNLETGVVYGSVTEAADHYGVKYCNIADCCNGRQKTSCGFHWAFADDTAATERFNTISKDKVKQVKRSVINLDTGERFESMSDAERRYGIWSGGICTCLSGKTKTAGGFHWAYA